MKHATAAELTTRVDSRQRRNTNPSIGQENKSIRTKVITKQCCQYHYRVIAVNHRRLILQRQSQRQPKQPHPHQYLHRLFRSRPSYHPFPLLGSVMRQQN